MTMYVLIQFCLTLLHAVFIVISYIILRYMVMRPGWWKWRLK